MSAICGEFVQNAWRKDLCSNCFKARSDHAAGHGAPADDGGCMPPLVAVPKMAPYVPFKRTIVELNGSNGSNGPNGTANNNNKLIGNNNHRNTSNTDFSTDRPIHRKLIGSSGVHLWEVGQMPRAVKNGVPADSPKIENGLPNDGAAPYVPQAGNPGGGKPGILKEKPKGPFDKPVGKAGQRSSVVFMDESRVIGYGGNDYNWDDEDESSEELSDVDSLDNFDLTEEDKVFGELTDRNTEYNADNTNLLLSEGRGQGASIFGRHAVADKLNPQSFYSMPVKAGHKVVSNDEASPGWEDAVLQKQSLDKAAPQVWEDAVLQKQSVGKASPLQEWEDAVPQKQSLGKAAPQDWEDAVPQKQSVGKASPLQDWEDAVPQKQSLGKAAPLRQWEDAVPQKQSVGKASPHRQWEDAVPQKQSTGNAAPLREWEDAVPQKQSLGNATPLHEWKDAVPQKQSSGNATPLREWEEDMAPQMQRLCLATPQDREDAVPQKQQSLGKTAPQDWENAVPQMQGFAKASLQHRSPAVLLQERDSINTTSDWNSPPRPTNGLVKAARPEHDSDWTAAEPPDHNSAQSAPEAHSASVIGELPAMRKDISDIEALASSPDQPSSDARCFIDSLFSAESEPTRLSFFTSEESEEDDHSAAAKQGPTQVPQPHCGTAPAYEPGFAASAHRAGIVTVPTRKHPVTHRATAQQLFNEEPVTAAELQAVSEKLPHCGAADFAGTSLMSTKPLSGPKGRNCSPYGIVPISKKTYAVPEPQRAPVIPTVPPPSSNDESQRYPYQPKGPQSTNGPLANGHCGDAKEGSLPRPSLGPCSTFHSPGPMDLEARFRNREYAAVNYSCHYASSYISGNSTTTLPPTPLTNPYSSTAILKGIPQAPDQRTRPVTMPKPKLPVKPVNIQRKPSEDCKDPATVGPEDESKPDNGAPGTPEAVGGERASACYQEIDAEDPSKTPSFESKVASLNGALDFGKRTPKRQAPRPPTGSVNGRTPEHNAAARRSSDQSCQDGGPQLTYVLRSSADRPASADRGSCDSMPNEGPSSNGPSGRTSSYSLEAPKAPPSGPLPHTPVFRENGKPKKSKFSLKKLLKFGSSSKEETEEGHRPKGKGLHHQNGRTKLEILHPIDLINAATNEVIDPASSSSDKGSSKTSSISSHQDVTAGCSAEPQADKREPSPAESSPDCPQTRHKPPPPPRSRSLQSEEGSGSKDKPTRPPPPIKRGQTLTRTPAIDDCTAEEPHQEDTPTLVLRARENSASLENGDNRSSVYSMGMEYANLGDVRNNLAPKKPGRCSSNSLMDIPSGCEMSSADDHDASGPRDGEARQLNSHAFGKAEVTYYAPTEDQQPAAQPEGAADLDDLYADQTPLSSLNLDSLSSGSSSTKPEAASDKVLERVFHKRASLEKVYAKSPVAAPPAPPDPGPAAPPAEPEDGAWPRRKPSRLSLRKTKTVVHKNLEDNYGAVVSANHQTLTQILEQVTLTQHADTSKAKLLAAASPRWSDFELAEDPATTVGDKAFYSAFLQGAEFTLMVSPDPLCAASHATRSPCVILPLAELADDIPTALLPDDFASDGFSSDGRYRRGTVWVLDRTRVDSLAGAAEGLRAQRAADPEAFEREACFVLLQLINGLKHLQVQGIEEVDAHSADFALTRKRGEANHRLVILPRSDTYPKRASDKVSLCQSALSAMMSLLNGEPNGAFQLIADVLRQERATSLSRAKMLLEYLLWGPTDLQGLQGPQAATPERPDEEVAYQRWLDLERATVLNNLIRTQSLWQIRLTVLEEYMLAFLVRACAKTLRDAAGQLRVNQ